MLFENYAWSFSYPILADLLSALFGFVGLLLNFVPTFFFRAGQGRPETKIKQTRPLLSILSILLPVVVFLWLQLHPFLWFPALGIFNGLWASTTGHAWVIGGSATGFFFPNPNRRYSHPIRGRQAGVAQLILCLAYGGLFYTLTASWSY